MCLKSDSELPTHTPLSVEEQVENLIKDMAAECAMEDKPFDREEFLRNIDCIANHNPLPCLICRATSCTCPRAKNRQ